MDFNEIRPSNSSPDSDPPLPPTDATSFEQQLNGAQGGATLHRAASPALQGQAYSPYLDTGHPYSPYLDIAHSHSPDLRWEDDPHALAALHADPAPTRSPHHLSQRAIEDPGFDQDLLWRNIDTGPSQAGPFSPGPSHARPSRAGPSQAGPSEVAPPELSEFRMRDGHLAKDYWVFTGQTATSAQIDMLERSGVLPTQDRPTRVFTLLGVPHTAEWREEGFIRLTPTLDPSLWLADADEDRPADPGEDSPAA